MARFDVAEKRIFTNIWICMNCNHKMRAQPGKRPDKCRKCGSKRLRGKRKMKKG
jgi:ribosomal protein L40E